MTGITISILVLNISIALINNRNDIVDKITSIFFLPVILSFFVDVVITVACLTVLEVF